jgi:hypothetical protein
MDRCTWKALVVVATVDRAGGAPQPGLGIGIPGPGAELPLDMPDPDMLPDPLMAPVELPLLVPAELPLPEPADVPDAPLPVAPVPDVAMSPEAPLPERPIADPDDGLPLPTMPPDDSPATLVPELLPD